MECVWKCTIIRFLLIILCHSIVEWVWCCCCCIKQHLTVSKDQGNDIPYVRVLSHNYWHTVFPHGMSSFNYYHFRFLKWPHSNASQYFIQICKFFYVFTQLFSFPDVNDTRRQIKKWRKKLNNFLLFQQMNIKKFPIH